MNSVNLIGRWVRDHEVINGNTTVVKNTIAVDHPFKKDDSSFIRVVMFGKTGELANQYTGKGTQIAIMGHIQTDSYEKSDGTKVYTTDVIANNIKFLEPKKEGQGGNYNQQANLPQDLNNPGQNGGYNNSQQPPQQAQYNQQANTQQNNYNGQNRSAGQSNGYQVPNNDTGRDPFKEPGGMIPVSEEDLPF